VRLLAISSQKGGVGKTTVSVNLAYSLARRGWNTLLVDTDPQGSVGLSHSEKARKSQGFYDAVHTGVSVLPLILPTRLPELNLLTAGQSHSFFGSGHESMDTLAALRRMVAEIATRPFDLVIFDTPAGLTGSSGDVLRLADSVLIPQQAEPLGIRSIPQMLQAIQFLRNHGSKLEVAGILMTMVQADLKESAEVVRELRALVPAQLLCQTSIPRDPVFLKASAAGVPLGLLHRNPPAAAHVFDQLAAELEPRLQLQAPDSANEYTRLMD
jgi:chromosome partitioning protein